MTERGGSAPDCPASTSELLERVYAELRALAAYHMARTGGEHTMPPTAVVHEAYLRLAEQDRQQWSSRAQFLAVASIMIRRILVDHARRRSNGQRVRASVASLPGGEPGTPQDVLSLDEALQALAKLSERQARVVELRHFGGLSVDETAEVLGISGGTVKSDWKVARAWLSDKLRA